MGKETKARLIGIDLLRCIAIYAVVVLHSDESFVVNSPVWSIILQFCSFAVPFFLATSFYLATDRLYAFGGNYNLTARLQRLLIPYAVWSVIYILYKVLKYLVAGEFDNLKDLFADPVAIIFFGGAAFHLYFLPLLISGTLLIKGLAYLIQVRIKPRTLVLLGVLSFFLYELILVSGNSFQIGPAIGFQPFIDSVFPMGNANPLLRVILASLALLIRCMPYVVVAAILTHPSIRFDLAKSNIRYAIFFCITFIAINLVGNLFLPEAFYEVLRGYLALCLALSLSTSIKPNFLIQSLSACSFGVYLMHLLIVESFGIIGNRLAPTLITQASMMTVLVISIVSLLISWGMTSVLLKRKPVAQYLFGV